jgi:RHH-type proline utilization regulon transcriptional repressor/proline dehydrogenase/delta 1-pyrroline-5-carboxylate dehydrogenase
VLAAIRGSGYGLTLGIHSRVESLAEHRVAARGQHLREPQHDRRRDGRAAVRRPGPVRHRAEGRWTHYLLRFVNERTLIVNTAAMGANVKLVS